MAKIPESMTYGYLRSLRGHHPAWRLLCADQAPLLAAFFYREFLATHRRGIEAQEILDDLDMFLFDVRQQENDGLARPAQEYLDLWTDTDHGWLRKYEYHGEWYYDLTASAQKAVEWLESLHQRKFVGTESRLRTVFNLLHEIARETDTDAEHRMTWLQEQIDTMQKELDAVKASGVVQPRLDDVQVRERFLEAEATASAILSDFREVEENFRVLTRQVRDDIVQWEKGKGELLSKIFEESDIIHQSEQGRSFAAFWRFLMLSQQQDDFQRTMARVSEAEPVKELLEDHPLAGINTEWVRAAGEVQQTLAQLSAQIRRYVDEDYLAQEKAIYEIIGRIERLAVKAREKSKPEMAFADMDADAPDIQLPMERKLFAVPHKMELKSHKLSAGDASEGKLDVMFDQVTIDREKLKSNIRETLGTKPSVTLKEVLEKHPLEQGLTELLAYFVLASHEENGFDPKEIEHLVFSRDGRQMEAICHRVVYTGRKWEE